MAIWLLTEMLLHHGMGFMPKPNDDRPIVPAAIAHVKIGAAFAIAGVSKILVTTLQAGHAFVSVRLEDPVDPFPLPK
jgi:hypothetical protein